MIHFSHFFCYSKNVHNKVAQIQTSEKLGILSQSYKYQTSSIYGGVAKIVMDESLLTLLPHALTCTCGLMWNDSDGLCSYFGRSSYVPQFDRIRGRDRMRTSNETKPTTLSEWHRVRIKSTHHLEFEVATDMDDRQAIELSWL